MLHRCRTEGQMVSASQRKKRGENESKRETTKIMSNIMMIKIKILRKAMTKNRNSEKKLQHPLPPNASF
jgi:hypothetical protein